jgi:hypothetical protein
VTVNRVRSAGWILPLLSNFDFTSLTDEITPPARFHPTSINRFTAAEPYSIAVEQNAGSTP